MTTNPETTSKKDYRNLDLSATHADFRRTMSGSPLLVLKGVNDAGKPSTAVVWGDDGEKLNGLLMGLGGISDNRPARLALEGYWRPREWQDQRGETRKSFEFVVKRFSHPELAREQGDATLKKTADPLGDHIPY